MSRLKLRNVATTLVLISVSMGLAIEFADGLASSSDQKFSEKEGIKELRSDFGSKSDTIKDQASETDKTQPEENQFFLTSVFNIIQTVVDTTLKLPTLANSVQNVIGINIPFLRELIGIVIIGVTFAFVSAARGWDV